MSAALIFDLSSIAKAAERIADLSHLDTEGLLDEMGAEVVTQIQRRIKDEKTAPDGSAWPELNKDYAARKAEKSSGGILEFEGNFVGSFQHHVLGDHVEAGSNLVFAAHLNFGGEEIGTGMPAREHLGFSDENEQDLQEIVDDFLTRIVSDL